MNEPTINEKWAGGSACKSMNTHFYSTDLEKQYEKHKSKKKTRDLLEKNGWLHKNQITYTFNSHGFRSEEFNDVEILFNGCSHTLGVGLPIEQIWSKKVADYFDVKYHSLAMAGSDNVFMAQRSVFWIPRLKPKYYVVQESFRERFNWWGPDLDNPTKVEMQTTGALGYTQIDRSILDMSSHRENYEWHYYCFRHIIEKICKQHNVKLIVLSDDRMAKINNPNLDLARDLQHRGQKENQKFARVVVDKIKKLA